MRTYLFISLASSAASVILVSLLTYYYHVYGTLLGFVLSQLCVFIIALSFMQGFKFDFKFFTFDIDFDSFNRLFKFSIMTLVSLISLPLVQVLLRNYVASHSSWYNVGYWQAMLKISDAYLLLVTTVISTYALPSYSRSEDKIELKKMVYSTILKLTPLVLLSALIIYSL